MGLRSRLRDVNDRAFVKAAAKGKGTGLRPGETRATYLARVAKDLPFMGAYADAFRPPVTQLAAEVVSLRRDIDALRREVAELREAGGAGPGTPT